MSSKPPPLLLIVVTLASLSFLPGLARGENPPTPDSLAGDWSGTLQVSGTELRVVFHFSDSDDGLPATLDSVDQGAMGIPINAVTFADRHLLLKIAAVGGTYEGDLRAAGNILGTWKQGGLSLPLALERLDGPLAGPTRPQHPKAPFPYRQQEVKIDNTAAEVTLAGTLTLPAGEGPFTAVVLITGSGPQDRDESLMGHKPFLVLADHLSRHGIAVLRHDDRGVGESSGSFAGATSRDFATDTAAAVAFLATRADIAAIGLVGHSEGGIIAPMVAVDHEEVDFLVLLAAPGINGVEILVAQGNLLLEQAGMPSEARQRNSALQRRAFAEALSGDSASLALTLRKMFAVQSPGLAGDQLEAQIKAQQKLLSGAWFRFFLSYDPRPALSELRVPVLALNGEKDLQVPARANLGAIRLALEAGGNQHFETHQLAGLNHLFQHAESGAISEYTKIEETFAEDVMLRISEWIGRQTVPKSDP